MTGTCVTAAILNQADPVALLRNYPSLAQQAEKLKWLTEV